MGKKASNLEVIIYLLALLFFFWGFSLLIDFDFFNAYWSFIFFLICVYLLGYDVLSLTTISIICFFGFFVYIPTNFGIALILFLIFLLISWFKYESNKGLVYKSPSNNNRYIPSNVKRAVWRRDQGRCVECGSNNKLEYDHLIPVSKGGSNTERNIQLLCEKCNRSKGGKII